MLILPEDLKIMSFPQTRVSPRKSPIAITES